MNKADLLDDLRSRIGVMADRYEDEIEKIYPYVCELLVQEVECYQSVLIYLVEFPYFKKCYYSGKENLQNKYLFGEGKLSIAAVRGGLVYEKRNHVGEVYIPFYLGHHLIGVFVVIGQKNAELDDEDLTLFCEITSLFESRIKKGKT